MVTPLLYGLYTGAVSIALMLLAYFTGIWKTDANNFVSWIALPFMVLFIWLAMKERKRDDFGGTMSYGQGVGTATLVGLFAGILVGIFMFVYLNNINPDYITVMVAQREAAMREMKNMKPEDIQRATDWTQKLFVPVAIGFVLFWDTFIGTVIGLIVSIFVRTKEQPQIQMTEITS